MEILDLMDRNRAIAEVMADCSRLSGGSGALAEAKYTFWVRAFEQMHPEPGQLPDTALTDVTITKGSKMGVLALRIMDYRREAPDSWLLTACGEIPELLKKGLRKLAGRALHQMHDGKSPPVGEIRGCYVHGDVVGLTCRVDATAVQKIHHEIFPLIEVSHSEGGEIYAVDLVDRPTGDELVKRGTRRLVRLYQREEGDRVKAKKMAKLLSKGPTPVYAPALPVAVERALAVRQAAEDRYNELPNLFTEAQFQRADDEVRKAVIATAWPVAVGADALVAFLRHGRP